MNCLLAFSLILACAALVPAAHAQELPPAAGAEKKFHNMDSRLAALYEQASGGQPTSNAAETGAGGRTVQVVLEMARVGAPVPQGLGISVEASYGELVQATVPVRNLGAIAADENVRLVKLPARPVPAMIQPTHADGPAVQGYGTVVTEGAGVMGSDALNSAGYTGKGVRVAVLDTGFDIYNPEIAANIRVHVF